MATLPPDAFPFCGPSSAAISPLFDAQRSINLYPEPGYKGAKSGTALIGTPGLSLFTTLPTSPVRGLWAGNGRLFAVGGSHVYEVNFDGSIHTDYGAIPSSSGFPCQFVANGRQLLVCDLSAGVIANVDPVGPAVTKVLSGFSLEYLDGFYCAIATGFSLAGVDTNQVNVSALLDGTTWPALDFVIRTGAVDQIVALAVINGQLWIFGAKRTEIWYNAGNPLFPFARQQGSTMDLGCLFATSLAKLNNTIFWVAGDDRGGGAVYMSSGGAPVRVSTFPIENLIGNYLLTANLPSTTAFAYQERGHVFYVLNFRAVTGNGPSTLVYDATTQLWHERGFWNVGLGQFQPHLADTFASVDFASLPPLTGNRPRNLVGDATSGNIYEMRLDFTSDNGNVIQRQRIAPHVSNENRYLSYPSLALDADIGTAAMVLDYSYNGGQSFLGRNRTIPKAGTLAAAGMDYYKISQLGRARDFVAKITITDANNPIRLINAYLDALKGTEQ